MYRLAKSADSIVQIFTSLCLSQVKEQLTENLIYCNSNPSSFIHEGHLYSFVQNRSLILDDSLVEYGINLNFRDTFN